jgi:hypothetical protein
MTKGTIGVISHDAGGAELLSLHLRNMGRNFLFCLDGPAVDVFKKNLGSYRNDELSYVIENSDYIMCGTSWQSTLENEAISLARKLSKKVISVIDHYCNYKDRYLKDGFDEIPDEIWVMDELSKNLVFEIAPNADVKIMGNPYLAEMKHSYGLLIEDLKLTSDFRVLYLTEPSTEYPGAQTENNENWKFNEFESLEYFLSNVVKLFKGRVKTVSIRQHPAEKQEKYSHYVGPTRGFMVEMSNEPNLLKDIARSEMLVGCDTMALMVGVTLGKKVYSSLPPGGGNPSLPKEGITYLREIL